MMNFKQAKMFGNYLSKNSPMKSVISFEIITYMAKLLLLILNIIFMNISFNKLITNLFYVIKY